MRNHKRWNPPQMYRRFETMRAKKIKESENEGTRVVVVVERKEEKNEKRNFLNHSLFIQPRSAFGVSIDIRRVLAHALQRKTRLHILQAPRPRKRRKASGGTSGCMYVPVRIKGPLSSPRVNPRRAKNTGNK